MSGKWGSIFKVSVINCGNADRTLRRNARGSDGVRVTEANQHLKLHIDSFWHPLVFVSQYHCKCGKQAKKNCYITLLGLPGSSSRSVMEMGNLFGFN